MLKVYEHYRNGLRFRRSSLDWSDDQKLEWTLRKLRQVVRDAAAQTRFYRDRYKSIGFDPAEDFTFDDFAKLPILTRDDVRIAGPSLISTSIPAGDVVRNATGGSTGAPTEIWMGPEERGWSESGLEFAFERIGIPPGSRLAYLWGHHLDPQLKPTLAEKWRGWALNYRFFDCFRLSHEVFASYHDQFERFSPDCIVAYASALGNFAEYLKERGIRPRRYPRICFVTGAEKLHAGHRSAIEEVFGKPVHERYGGRDFGPAAIQLSPGNDQTFAVDWSWALIEPETSEPRSTILVTKFHADAMPMIRYRVGDVGSFNPEATSGTPAFALCEVIGRQTEGIRKPDGSWLHGIQLPHLLKDFPVREFSLVQEADLSLELKIVRRDSYEEADEHRIVTTINANAGNLPLKVVYVDEVERGPASKWMPVVSKALR